MEQRSVVYISITNDHYVIITKEFGEALPTMKILFSTYVFRPCAGDDCFNLLTFSISLLFLQSWISYPFEHSHYAMNYFVASVVYIFTIVISLFYFIFFYKLVTSCLDLVR